MSTELTQLQTPNVAPGTSVREVRAVPIALEAEQPMAMLIHEVGISFDARAVAAGNSSGRCTVELGLSTDQSGTPMAVMAAGNYLVVAADAGAANANAGGVLEETDAFNLIEGTIWVAPYWVLFVENENLNDNVQPRVQVKYDLIELDDFRTQLAMWNRVDEVNDRERATTVFP